MPFALRPEQAMWSRIGPQLRTIGVFERVENSRIAPGMPDVSYSVQGGDGWIELKSARETPTGKVKIGIRKKQRTWAAPRLRLGTRVFLLAEVVRKNGVAREFFLIGPESYLRPELQKAIPVLLMADLAVYRWTNQGKMDLKSIKEHLSS